MPLLLIIGRILTNTKTSPLGLFSAPSRLTSVGKNRSGRQHQNVRCVKTQQTARTDMDQPTEKAELGAVPVRKAVSQPRRLSIR